MPSCLDLQTKREPRHAIGPGIARATSRDGASGFKS
jgi:hypothetical protein